MYIYSYQKGALTPFSKAYRPDERVTWHERVDPGRSNTQYIRPFEKMRSYMFLSFYTLHLAGSQASVRCIPHYSNGSEGRQGLLGTNERYQMGYSDGLGHHSESCDANDATR